MNYRNYFLNLLSETMNKKLYIKSSDIYFTIDGIDLYDTKCNACNVKYETINFTGLIYIDADDYKEPMEFDGFLESDSIFCKCKFEMNNKDEYIHYAINKYQEVFEEKEKPLLLLSLHFGTKIYREYIDKKDLIIVKYIPKIKTKKSK